MLGVFGFLYVLGCFCSSFDFNVKHLTGWRWVNGFHVFFYLFFFPQSFRDIFFTLFTLHFHWSIFIHLNSVIYFIQFYFGRRRIFITLVFCIPVSSGLLLWDELRLEKISKYSRWHKNAFLSSKVRWWLPYSL